MLSPVTYLNEAIEELHHVRWPTRQQAVRLSIVVLGFTLVCALAFGITDFLLANFLTLILPGA
jgi:preprotein translocase SecE subunit